MDDAARHDRFYLPALDSLRLVAWLMVFLVHVLPERVSFLHAPLAAFIYSGVRASGGYGVSVFFCLSAFLITRLLLLERERTGGIAVPQFYARRILRIWPVYYLTLLVGCLVVPRLTGTPLPAAYWLGWLGMFTGNFVMSREHQALIAIAPLWSVCVEEQFYIVWPWAVKQLSPRWLVGLCSAVLLLAPLYRALAASHGGLQWDIWFKTATHLDCFAAGALLAVYWERLQAPRLTRWGPAAMALGAIVIVSQALYAPLSAVDNPAGPLGAASYSLIALAGTLLVWAVGVRPAGAPSWLSRVTRYGGRISYGLYCYHGVVLNLTLPLLGSISMYALILLRFVLTWLVASASFAWYEQAFLRLKGKFQRVRSGPDTAGG